MNSFFRILLVSISLTLPADMASAAFKVIYVDYGRNFFFVFNGGSDAGVKAGMTACVDDAQGWELFCGKVERVRRTVAALEAPDNYEAYFEEGLRVRIVELGDPEGHKRDEAENASDEAPDSGPVERSSFWTFGIMTTPVLPYTVTLPDFAIEARMSGKGYIWGDGPIVRSSRLGFSVGRRTPWSKSFDHEIGMTWRLVTAPKKQVDYDQTDPQVYVAEQATLTDYSLSWNFLSPALATGFSPGWIAGGAFQYVSFNYKSTIVDDTSGSQSGELATSTARLLGLIARIGARLEYVWDNSTSEKSRAFETPKHRNVGFSLVGLLPLYSQTSWKHSDHNLPSDATQKDSSQSQFAEVAAFKRTSYGFESSLYLSWAF